MNASELKLRFNCKAKVLINEKIDKYLASHASLERLRSLVPNDIDLDYNDDVLCCAADLTLVNRANLNGHLITNKEAVLVAKHLKYKFANIEHDRRQLCGVISKAGFYSVEGEELTEEEALNKKEPFYLSVSFLIYKSVLPGLIPALEATSDLTTEDIISLSWEIKFKDYNIMYGSKDYYEATVISDPEEIEKLKGKLKIFGGSGRLDDGTPLYIVATEEIIPEGMGLTLNPAAAVKGLIVIDPKIENEENELEEESSEDEPILPDDKLAAFRDGLFKIAKETNVDFSDIEEISSSFSKMGLSIEDILKRTKDAIILSKVNNLGDEPILPDNKPNAFSKSVESITTIIEAFRDLNSTKIINKLSTVDDKFKESTQNLKNNTSQNNNDAVIAHMDKKLKIEDVKEITNENLINIEASAIVDFISDSLTKASEEYAKKVKEKEQEVEASKVKEKELEEKVKSLESTSAELTSELNKIKEVSAAKEQEDLFNARMSSLDETYELDKEKRAIIAKQIKDLSKEDYESWANDFATLNKSLVKSAGITSAASVEEEKIDAAELLEKGKQKNPSAISTQSTQESKLDAWKSAFSMENIQFGRNRKNIK